MPGKYVPPPLREDNPQTLRQTIINGPLTAERCRELRRFVRRADADDRPVIQRLADAMTAAEREYVHRTWVALTKASWYDAFAVIAQVRSAGGASQR